MGGVEFQKVDEEACLFPRSPISMTPRVPIIRRPKAPRAGRPIRSRFHSSDCVAVAAGRYAIALSLRAAGVQPGDTVLLPAYHCGSMVEPALSIDARVAFYRHERDLSPDVEDLDRKLRRGARAVLLAHYFGFPQRTVPILARCKDRGAKLVEDCAHALYGDFEGKPPGSVGHFAVASCRKFIPVSDGGKVCSNDSNSVAWPRTHPPGPLAELRAFYGLGQRLWEEVVRRRKGGNRIGRDGGVQDIGGRAESASASSGGSPGAPGMRWFQREHAGSGMTRAAHLLARWADVERIAAVRRANYEGLLEGCAGLRRATPLFSELPEGVVPYAFPLVLRWPREDFRRLKYAGVPMWRWDELAVSDCQVSQQYRHALVQLPCHENLMASEISWLLGVLREVLG